MPELLTPDQARSALDQEGKTIAEFARENDLLKETVYQVLDGRKKGRRGEAHRAAVLLGIKQGNFPATIPMPITTEPQ